MPWLYLLRHGIPEEDDVDPGLSIEGVRLMRDEAEGMARLGFSFDSILTSPLRRSRETAETVAERFAIVDRVHTVEQLAPGCRVSSFETVNAPAGHVLAVGHAPDMGRLACELIGVRGALALGRGGLIRLDLYTWPPAPPARLDSVLPADVLVHAGRDGTP